MRGNLILIAWMAVGIAILSALGFWQVQRLAWKENLIATVEARRTMEPVSLERVETMLEEAPQSIEFRPVSVAGRFLHDFEQHYYVTREGEVGWHIFTPMVLDDGRVLFVNRGFLPERLKRQDTRQDGLVDGEQRFDGLARTAPDERPNSFVPDNDPAANIYFWKSLAQMREQLPAEYRDRVLPFFVDAGKGSNQGGRWPEGGSTRISFPNNHLQYAITWFALALALLGVGSYFLYARMRRSAEASGDRE
jgi:surfeit locus 1 family protein